jgi:hypothetical protein
MEWQGNGVAREWRGKGMEGQGNGGAREWRGKGMEVAVPAPVAVLA